LSMLEHSAASELISMSGLLLLVIWSPSNISSFNTRNGVRTFWNRL
jgi:hypothetical protein